MVIEVHESNMRFGPFEQTDLLQIETCQAYQEIQQNVAIAEFLVSRPTEKCPNRLWVVEAKSSSPHPETQPEFDGFIDGICQKFINSMNLFLSGVLLRNSQMKSEIPSGMRHVTAKNADFRFVLVIKGHRAEWLAPLKSALERQLKPSIKTWSLNSACVIVINDELARQHQLII